MQWLVRLWGVTVLGLALGSSAAAQDLENLDLDVEDAFPLLGFTRPVVLAHAGDGTDRLFVVEQPGSIRVFPNDPAAASAPVFLDLRSQVNAGGSEEGLLGLAFAPDCAASGEFYVYYSAITGSQRAAQRTRGSLPGSTAPLVARRRRLPWSLTWAQIRGHYAGPLAMYRSRRRARRLGASRAGRPAPSAPGAAPAAAPSLDSGCAGALPGGGAPAGGREPQPRDRL